MAINEDSKINYSDAYPDWKRPMVPRRKRTRVYIAGPMTNGTGGTYNMKKINKAIKTYFALIKQGFVPHCPQLTVFAEFLQPECVSYKQWLELDRCYIDDCDVLLRLEGDSKGADLECDYARSIGKDVVYGFYKFLIRYKEATV